VTRRDKNQNRPFPDYSAFGVKGILPYELPLKTSKIFLNGKVRPSGFFISEQQ
jgi:uncharacterized protein involved in copper resistance